MSSLLEGLGLAPDTRAVIIVAAGLGTCHACNRGVYEATREGVATAARLRVPCPWARGAAADYRGDDIGVSLTLTSEFEHYQWGPITHAPSLLGGDGGFPKTTADVWDHADPSEVYRECRAQIERAVLWGIDVTHLASQGDVMISRPELFDVIAELAEEFALPVRLADDTTLDRAGFPVAALAADRGLVHADRVVAGLSTGNIEQFLQDLRPGVTEVSLTPAVATSELQAITNGWQTMIDDLGLLTDHTVADRLADADVRLIGYRDLRDLVRAGHSRQGV